MLDAILGRAAYSNHELFEKYGPVVRVEPNFVMLADPKYLKPVYGYGSGFYKTEVGSCAALTWLLSVQSEAEFLVRSLM